MLGISFRTRKNLKKHLLKAEKEGYKNEHYHYLLGVYDSCFFWCWYRNNDKVK